MGLVSRSKVSASSVRESLNQMNSNRTSSVEPILQCFNKSLFHASNLCTPFKHDIRCTSLCGVEFVVTKERREKRAQRESCLKGVQRLNLKILHLTSFVVFEYLFDLFKIFRDLERNDVPRRLSPGN